MLDFLLDVLFPKKCVSCGRWGKYICDRCITRIDFFVDQVCPYCERPSPYGFTHPRCQKPLGLDGMFILAHYRGPIRKALREIKYRGTYGVISGLEGQLVSRYQNQYNFDYLVPVPLHPKRERERGFNQAEKLAKALARMINDKLSISNRGQVKNLRVISLLKRNRETRPQFDLKYEERKQNVRDAFALISNFKFQISNSSVCLVDDVATTGATIFECGKVLKKAGAKKVYAICVARGG